MEMFLVKSNEGYLRFLKDGSFEVTNMDKASVYPDRVKCEEIYNNIKKTIDNSSLRISKITITEEDFQ